MKTALSIAGSDPSGPGLKHGGEQLRRDPADGIHRERDCPADLPEQLHAPGRDARLAAGGEDVSQSDICAAQGLSLPGLLQRVAGGSKLGKTGPDRFVQAPEGGHGQMEGVRTQGQGGLRMVMEDAGDPGLTAQG